MDINLNRAGIELEAHRFLTLHDAAGVTVLCLQGELWITQHHDQRDHFVRAGECFTVGLAGTTLVQAEAKARLVLLERKRKTKPRRFEWPSLPGGRMLLARLHGA